jgi:preprotein translocase subunit SecD
VITGNFTPQQANDLGVELRGGALPVPVRVKVVTPTSPSPPTGTQSPHSVTPYYVVIYSTNPTT